MKEKIGRLPIMIFLCAAAVAGYLLRSMQLKLVFDTDGLPVAGHTFTVIFAGICAAVALVMLLLSLSLRKQERFDALFHTTSAPLFVLSAAAAVLIAAACALSVREHVLDGKIISAAVDLLGLACALCILASAAGRKKGGAPHAGVYIFPFLFLMLRLIMDFKSWSTDPTILDYCFKLFALLCILCGVYRLAGYSFDKGRRNLTAFWCLIGVFFCAVDLADGGLSQCLFYGGFGLWLAVNGWLLTKSGVAQRD